jgi:DNA polymerase III subunit gamma/tau
MSYLVLARKWRPESFADVVGQKHVVLTLEAAINNDRLAHAYLFAGPRGVGKTTIARILAKALNCEKGPTTEPCGTCSSCAEIASGRSLDVIEIDGASNRKIEDARGIRETVQYAPLSGRMKIYIIDEAHMLTREAFNALLKTIEEPPPHVVFVLATTEPGKIPETISSRCQTFDFHRISAAEIEARLRQIAEAEHFDVEDGALAMVAARADGSMRDAVSLLDQLVSVGEGKVAADDVSRVLGIPDVDVYFGLTDAIAGGDTAATLAALRAALDSGFDVHDLLDGLVEHLRNLLLIKATDDADGVVGRASAYVGRDGASSGLAEDDIVRLLRIGVEAQGAVKWSTQPVLIVELALVRMARLPDSVEIADVIRALNEGGQGTPGGGGRGGGAAPHGGRGRAQGRPSGRDGGTATEAAPAGAAGLPAAAHAASAGPAAGAGTAVDAPPAADSADAAVDTERWQEVLGRIRATKPALAAFLADAVPSSDGRAVLQLEVPNGSRFHREQLRDRANLKIMERAAGETFGGRVSLSFTFGDSHKRQAATRGGPAVSAEATDDPLVRKVLDVFGGDIIDSRREE